MGRTALRKYPQKGRRSGTWVAYGESALGVCRETQSWQEKRDERAYPPLLTACPWLRHLRGKERNEGISCEMRDRLSCSSHRVEKYPVDHLVYFQIPGI